MVWPHATRPVARLIGFLNQRVKGRTNHLGDVEALQSKRCRERFQILLGLWDSFWATGLRIDAASAEWDAWTAAVLHGEGDTASPHRLNKQ